MRSLRSYRAVTLAGLLCIVTTQPAVAAGNLTLPFNIPNPRITSWMDHHYPNRQADGIMVRINQVVIETSAQLHHQRGKERSDPIATRFNEGLVLLVASG